MPRRSHLRHLLLAHSPGDAQEAAHVQSVLQLLETSGDPFSREHFQPGHVTASAFVVSPDAQDLLLIFHGKLHRWLQPGGHVEPDDEDVLAAARREVLEEVGLSGLELLHAWPGLDRR